MMRLTAGVVFTIGLTAQAVFAAAATADPAGEFKTWAARDAMTTYSAATNKAAREYQDKLAIARKACIASLNAAKDDATKAANLDEAVRIRDTVTRLQNEAAAVGAAAAPKAAPLAGRERLAARLAGTAWDTAGKPYRFNADGTMTVGVPNSAPWQWAAIGDHEVVVRRADGWTERYTFDDDLKFYTVVEFGNGTKGKIVKRMQ
jgi:hypothetical protein